MPISFKLHSIGTERLALIFEHHFFEFFEWNLLLTKKDHFGKFIIRMKIDTTIKTFVCGQAFG